MIEIKKLIIILVTLIQNHVNQEISVKVKFMLQAGRLWVDKNDVNDFYQFP
jgi:hypothetical protein